MFNAAGAVCAYAVPVKDTATHRSMAVNFINIPCSFMLSQSGHDSLVKYRPKKSRRIGDEATA
jgi:hypothetical protein